jgi:uncharacterized protein (DUF58 family)
MSKPKIRIALNREGALFFFFVLGLGASAIYSGKSGLMLLFCCMIAAIVVFAIMAHQNFQQSLKIERRFVEEVFAGCDTRIDLLITNEGSAPIYGIHIFEKFESERTIGPMFIRRLAPGETATARYMCVFPSRGQAQFCGFEIRSRFPLPFFELRRDIPCKTTHIVYPEPITGTEHIVFQPAESQNCPRKHRFSENVIRELVHGRRAGRILWKLSAKRQTWLESVPLRTRSAATMPAIFITPKMAMHDEIFERQISQITAYILTQIQLDRTGEVHFGKEQLTYGKSPQQRREILEMLAMIQ